MDEDKRAFYEYHASLMEPWDGPAAMAFTDGRVDRRDARPQRAAARAATSSPRMIWSCWPRKPACSMCLPRTFARRAACSPAACSSWTRFRSASSRTRRSRSSWQARQPYGEWLQEQQVTLDHLPEPSRVIASNPETLLRRQRAYGYSEEDLRILLGADGRHGRGAGRLDGHRYAAGLPVRPSAAAVQLFQAALRTGHQSADRSDPRRAGDVAHQLHRHRAQHPGRGAGELPHPQAAASDSDQSRSGEAAPRFVRRSAGDNAAGALPRRRWRSRPASLAGRTEAIARRMPWLRAIRC